MKMTVNDQQEFRKLVHELSGPLLRFAAGILRDQHAAHDVVQDALLNVWKRGAFRFADSSRAYCYRVVRNQCISFLRRKKLRDRVESEAPAMSEQSRNPQLELAKEAWQQALQLPAELREIVILHYGHGLSVSEVAETTDTPRGTVATRLRRALENLRSSMLATPAAVFSDDTTVESALRSRPELASDMPVSNSLVASLEATVMAGIGAKSIWGAASMVALALLLGVGVTVAAVAMSNDPARVNVASQRTVTADGDSPAPGESTSVALPVDEVEVPTETTPGDSAFTEPEDSADSMDMIDEWVMLQPVRVTVRGRVIDDDQRPVAHADVSIAVMDERFTPVKPVLATTTSSAGGDFEAVFRVQPNDPAFPSSINMLCAWATTHGRMAPGPSMFAVSWFVDDTQVVRDGLVLQVRQSRVARVRVQNSAGEPVPGAHVWWRRLPYLARFGADSPGPEVTPEGRTLEFVTGADGLVEVEVPRSEQMQAVQVFAEGHIGEYVTFSGRRSDTEEIVVTLRAARLPLTLELQDLSGLPLADLSARVSYEWRDARYESEASLRGTLRTDTAGEITLTDAPPRTVRLDVKVDGYRWESVTVTEGQTHATVALMRWNRIEVRFQDDTGRPLELEDAHVTSLMPDFSYSLGRRLVAEWSGDEDEVEFELKVAGWTSKVRKTLRRSGGAVQLRTLKAPETALFIRGRVRLSDGNPAPGATVYFSDSKSGIDRILAELDPDMPRPHGSSVTADTTGLFELRLDGFTLPWLQAERRGVRSACMSVGTNDGRGEVTLTLAAECGLKVIYGDALAGASPRLVLRDRKGNVVARAEAGPLALREVELSSLPSGTYTATLMTGQSRVVPYDGDPYSIQVTLKEGEQATLDLSHVQAVRVTAAISLGAQVLGNDGLALLMWVRIGPDEDVSTWDGIARVLDSHTVEIPVLNDAGECEVSLLPGRYAVMYFDSRSTSWVTNTDVTDRPNQQLQLTLQEVRR